MEEQNVGGTKPVQAPGRTIRIYVVVATYRKTHGLQLVARSIGWKYILGCESGFHKKRLTKVIETYHKFLKDPLALRVYPYCHQRFSGIFGFGCAYQQENLWPIRAGNICKHTKLSSFLEQNKFWGLTKINFAGQNFETK